MQSNTDPIELIWLHQLRSAQVQSTSQIRVWDSLYGHTSNGRHPIIDLGLAGQGPMDLNSGGYRLSSLVDIARTSLVRRAMMLRDQEIMEAEVNALKRRRDIFELSSQVHLHQLRIPQVHELVPEPKPRLISPSETGVRRTMPSAILDHILNVAQPEKDHRSHDQPKPHETEPRQLQEECKPTTSLLPPLPPSRSISASSSLSSVPAETYVPPAKRAKKAVAEDIKPEENQPPKVEKPAKYPKKDTKWMHSFDQLLAYKDEYGDCVVPRGYTPNPRLASWVAEQRKQYKLLQDGKASCITSKRIQRLDSLDFAWNAQCTAWNRHMKALRDYKNKYGDCLVPLGHQEYPKLGLWVKEQRRHFILMKTGKRTHMTEERAQALEGIGFCWDTHRGVWGERCKELRQYKAEHGDCLVPTSYKNHPKLSTWVLHQRRQFKKFKDGQPCHITLERIRTLDKLGFTWHPRKHHRKAKVNSKKPKQDKKPAANNQKGRSYSFTYSSSDESDDSSLSVSESETNHGSMSDSETDGDESLQLSVHTNTQNSTRRPYATYTPETTHATLINLA